MLPPEDETELRRIGVSATPLDRASDALARLLGSAVAQAAVVRIDWPLFQAVYQVRGSCRMFELVAGRPASKKAPAVPAPEPAGILERLRQAPAADRREVLVAHLQATLGQVLGLDPGRLPDCQQGFFDMGMDSLTAMEFRTSLQASLAVELAPTLAFDYGTIDTLADFLLRDRLAVDPLAPAPEAAEPDGVTEGVTDATRAMMERMSDDEVKLLLQAKLLTL
jgi:acyl carrier protein